MSFLSRSSSPPPYIANIISRLNTIKSNVNSKLNTIKSNINNLKSQPKLVNSGKNAKIKYLDEQIKRVEDNMESLYDYRGQRSNTLKQEGKTHDEIHLDHYYMIYQEHIDKLKEKVSALEKEKHDVIMSGGKTRRNKRKNRKTRKNRK